MSLSADERERYARHLALPEIVEQGQERLRDGSVLVVGAGGLGSPAALYLAAAGVGTLGIADADVVEISNLQRQLLHHTPDVGRPKVASAVEKLQALNPHVTVRAHCERLTSANAERILADYSFVVDATDNFASKFLIADACHRAQKPYSHAGILRFLGQTMTVLPGVTACYRCVFDSPPDESSGVRPQGPLGVVPGVIGAIQATEVIKYLLGIGDPLTNTLLVYKALEMTFRRVPVKRNPECPLCREQPV
ncbi:MAG: HesA/MoeB/ThiF family protein [Kiritimatiellia bacterium]